MPRAEDPSCPMLKEFRFEDCSLFPIEIFIDLYKNTTFNLKSPLASLYKHRKCYWALEISFNEGKVFLLKSVIFPPPQHNIFRGAGEVRLFWALRKQTNPCLTHDMVTWTIKRPLLREARKGEWGGGNNETNHNRRATTYP